MSHILRRVALAPALLLAASLGLLGCDAANGDPDGTGAPAAGGKADETAAGPVGTLATGASATGYVAGDAVHVYVVQARQGSVVNARIERTDGNLDPKAFLYRGLSSAQSNDYMRPTHGFSNTSSSIEAGWEVTGSGELLLIVSATSGTAGNFSVAVTCHADSPLPCTENGEQDELAVCEYVRDAWARCAESDNEDEEVCGDWLGFEDTTQDDECCELWDANGLPTEDFCP